MTPPRRRRRRMKRAMLARRRRFVIHTTGVFETPHEIRTIHEIPRKP